MRKHLINYDLRTPGKDYKELISAIKAYGEWAKICESCWAIRSDDTDSQIRDNLEKHIDQNDRLFVCAFGGWASYVLKKDVSDWLHT